MDAEGNIIGIVDARRNHTTGLDYIPGEYCHADSEIDNLLETDGLFRVNYLSEKFATTVYEGKPVFHANNWLKDYYVYLDRSYHTQASLRQNNIKTQDSWI